MQRAVQDWKSVDSMWKSRVPEDRGSGQGVVSYAIFTRLECTRRPSLGSEYSATVSRSLVLLARLTHRALVTSHNHSHRSAILLLEPIPPFS